MEYDVRRGVAADAVALAALAARTFTDAFGADNRPEDLTLHLARSYGEEQQRAELTNPGMTTFVAESDRRLIGFAQLREGSAPASVREKKPVELMRFYVAKEWHGRGLAQQLMQAAISDAERRGGTALWLGVWEKNPRAIAFYSKVGFRDVGSQVFVVGTDPQTDRVLIRVLGNRTSNDPLADR
jgi:diamine N-acetyltransferase